MISSTKDLEKRLAQLRQAVPKRGMERHPTVLKNTSELPTELQSPVLTSLAESENVQRVISFPQQIHRGNHYVPKQALLFTSSGVIHIFASIWPGQEPEITHLQGYGILYMQVTLILLYGFLEIVAQGKTTPTRLGVEFNLVAWDLLSKPVRQLLQATRPASFGAMDKIPISGVAQQTIDNLPLKFRNGIRIYGILPSERLEELVFQPGTWKRNFLFFRRSILANTLVLLTSNYVVVIKEELDVSQGWIITYIPRNNIIGIKKQQLNERDELTVLLNLENLTTEYKIQISDEIALKLRSCWTQHGGQWKDLPGEMN